MDELIPPKMTIREKIRVALQSIRIEVVILFGVIGTMSCMILIIWKLTTTEEMSTVVIGKLLDQLNTLEGALIAWGTSFIGAAAARMRNDDK